METTHPLTLRQPNDAIAYLFNAVDSLGQNAGPVSTSDFLQHVAALSKYLNNKQFCEAKHVINMCDNRYLFMLAFCAVILSGKTNLLPPNKNPITQKNLADDYAKTIIIHDGLEVDTTTSSIDLRHIQLNDYFPSSDETTVPNISDSHLASITFTSGSTGKSKANKKYWRTIHRSTALNYRFMIEDDAVTSKSTLYQLATVPAQHMWGLETSVMLPLFYNICSADAKPLLPSDVITHLNALPEPRMLVSTPVHLRSLVNSDIAQSNLSLTLCATSPLTPQLADSVEKHFSCKLKEVYGCSEVGSMAVRRTSVEKAWQRFDEISFTAEKDKVIASAEHLPEAITLQDKLIFIDDSRFELAGRDTDLVKIAGKRASLFQLNALLLRFDGLEDGIVLQPYPDDETRRLCAIVALRKTTSKKELQNFLRENLDSAFIPRPIYVVDALPRESNGKLLKVNIDKLLKNIRKN